MTSKASDAIRLCLELALYAAGAAMTWFYYRSVRFNDLSKGWKVLITQAMLVALGVLTARIFGRARGGQIAEKEPESWTVGNLFAAAFLVPVVVVPPTALVDELLNSSTPTSIFATLVAALFYVPFAWIITTAYGIPIYLLMRRFRACRPWSLAALGFAFMYVAFNGPPLGTTVMKCMSGASVALGAWAFVSIAERRNYWNALPVMSPVEG